MSVVWPSYFSFHQVLLAHSQRPSVYLLSGCCVPVMAESSRGRPDGPQSQKYLLSGFLWKIFADFSAGKQIPSVLVWIQEAEAKMGLDVRGGAGCLPRKRAGNTDSCGVSGVSGPAGDTAVTISTQAEDPLHSAQGRNAPFARCFSLQVQGLGWHFLHFCHIDS